MKRILYVITVMSLGVLAACKNAKPTTISYTPAAANKDLAVSNQSNGNSDGQNDFLFSIFGTEKIQMRLKAQSSDVVDLMNSSDQALSNGKIVKTAEISDKKDPSKFQTYCQITPLMEDGVKAAPVSVMKRGLRLGLRSQNQYVENGSTILLLSVKDSPFDISCQKAGVEPFMLGEVQNALSAVIELSVKN